jgi:ribosomal protein L11 methyltransferase
VSGPGQVLRLPGAAARDAAWERLVAMGAREVAVEGPDLLGLFPAGVGADAGGGADAGEGSWEPARMLDWGSVWEGLLAPFTVGGVRIGGPAGQDALSLEVGSAFGSAHHPTTRMCLEWVAEEAPQAPLLDVGTGTGVLALLALRLGAPQACGVEIDADARAIAARNARDNGLGERLLLRAALPERPYPRVVANLSSGGLVALGFDLARCLAPGGALAVSGLSEELAPEVDRHLRQAGLRPAGACAREGWCRLDYRAGW